MNEYPTLPFSGIVFIDDSGKFGQLVPLDRLGKISKENPYLSKNILMQYRLRTGMYLQARIRERHDFPNPCVTTVEEIDGIAPDKRSSLPKFENRTPTLPNQLLRIESQDENLSSRLIDLFAPIGKGQRSLIVAPPKTGKTTLLQDIAKGLLENNPHAYLISLLVDERPEEVTEFRRAIPSKLFASSNDEPCSTQIQVAELAIEHAKRLVETGKDVIILLDSITRLARAYNRTYSSGRTLSGGVDIKALERPRQLFASARNLEGNGSLTIIATALVDTGSRMDDLIFQEFKGTGNSEIVLNKKAAEMRIYPAINITESGTRQEAALLDETTLAKIGFLRRAVANMKTEEATESIISRIKKTKNNKEFLILLQTTLSH